MKNQFFILTSTILTLSLLTGCGAFKVRDKNVAEVEKIKKVAVVAFTMDEPAPVQIGLNLGSGKLEANKGGSALTENSPHVDQLLSDLEKAVQSKLRWQVLEHKKMLSNGAYTKAYQDTMEGWQNKMPIPEGQSRFVIDKMLDQDALRIMGPQGRDALIAALGVDAIMMAKINVHIEANTIMGIGSRYPKSSLSFYVYKKGTENPVWFDGQVEGETSKESVGKTNLFNASDMHRLAAESAKTAFLKIDSEPAK